MRGAVKQEQSDAPVSTAVSQIAASLPLGGPLAKLMPGGASLWKQMLAGMGISIPAGYFAGAGDSEATTSEGVMDDAASAAQAAGLMGLVLPPALRGGGAVAKTAASALNDSAAGKYALQKVAEAFARDAAPGVTTPLVQAERRMLKLGPEAAVVDAGGDATRQLLDTQVNLPGKSAQEARRFIEGRQAGRADRMIEGAERASGTGGIRLAPTMDDWVQQRAAAAGPLYERLHRVDVPVDATLDSIVSRLQEAGAGKLARETAAVRNLPFSLAPEEVALTGQYSMRDLDLLKGAVDDILQSPKAWDKEGQKFTRYGAALNDLRKDLLANLDTKTNGLYKQARDAFAGPSAVMDAAKQGRAALQKDDATIKSMMDGLSLSEKDAFALGAFEALRAKLGTMAGQSEMMNLWRQKGLQEKLKAIFGTERAYREFASRMEAERVMRGVESVRGGSQTARRQFAAGDLDMSALSSVADAAGNATTGNVPALLRSVSNGWNRVKTPEAVRNQIGSILMSRGPEAQSNVNALSQIMREVELQRQRELAGLGLTIGTQTGL